MNPNDHYTIVVQVCLKCGTKSPVQHDFNIAANSLCHSCFGSLCEDRGVWEMVQMFMAEMEAHDDLVVKIIEDWANGTRL